MLFGAFHDPERAAPRSRRAVGVGDVAGERGDRAAILSSASTGGDIGASSFDAARRRVRAVERRRRPTPVSTTRLASTDRRGLRSRAGASTIEESSTPATTWSSIPCARPRRKRAASKLSRVTWRSDAPRRQVVRICRYRDDEPKPSKPPGCRSRRCRRRTWRSCGAAYEALRPRGDSTPGCEHTIPDFVWDCRPTEAGSSRDLSGLEGEAPFMRHDWVEDVGRTGSSSVEDYIDGGEEVWSSIVRPAGALEGHRGPRRNAPLARCGRSRTARSRARVATRRSPRSRRAVGVAATLAVGGSSSPASSCKRRLRSIKELPRAPGQARPS